MIRKGGRGRRAIEDWQLLAWKITRNINRMESDVKFVSGRDSLEASMRGMRRGKLENDMGVLGL